MIALHRTAARHLPWLVAVVAVTGCSANAETPRKPVHPVRGSIFVDGQPAADAFVLFHPVSDPDRYPTKAFGRVGKDGSFRLSTYDTGDGAPAGDYAVTITWRRLNEAEEAVGSGAGTATRRRAGSDTTSRRGPTTWSRFMCKSDCPLLDPGMAMPRAPFLCSPAGRDPTMRRCHSQQHPAPPVVIRGRLRGPV